MNRSLIGIESMSVEGSGGSSESLSVSTASISFWTIPCMPNCSSIESAALLPEAYGVGEACAMNTSAAGAPSESSSVVVAEVPTLVRGEILETSSSAVPKVLLILVWTDLACWCSYLRYSLSSAIFRRALLPSWVHNLVRMVPNILQRCEAELGQMERIWCANWARGVSGWFGWDMASQTSSGLSFVP